MDELDGVQIMLAACEIEAIGTKGLNILKRWPKLPAAIVSEINEVTRDAILGEVALEEVRTKG